MAKKEKVKKEVYGFTGAFGLVTTDTNVKESEKSFTITEALCKKLGYEGRILFGSKTSGHEVAKKKKIVFISNSNIFTADGCKVWFGDFLSSKDTLEVLQSASKDFNMSLYVLRESLGRFLPAPPDNKYLQENYSFKITDKEIVDRSKFI